VIRVTSAQTVKEKRFHSGVGDTAVRQIVLFDRQLFCFESYFFYVSLRFNILAPTDLAEGNSDIHKIT
jgi:hypothetical protein